MGGGEGRSRRVRGQGSKDEAAEVDRHAGRPHLRGPLAASRLRGSLCLQRLQGEVREGFCRGLDEGNERRSLRSPQTVTLTVQGGRHLNGRPDTRIPTGASAERASL